jgi:hypothetical protein
MYHVDASRFNAFFRDSTASAQMREDETRRMKDKRRNAMVERMEGDLEKRRQESLRVELKQKGEADGKEAAEAARRAEIARLEQVRRLRT